jgi:hypothetical protein
MVEKWVIGGSVRFKYHEVAENMRHEHQASYSHENAKQEVAQEFAGLHS